MNESTLLQELLARAADGDRDAQSAVLSQFWPLIRHAVRGRKSRMGRAIDDTADLEQAAAMRVLLELPKHTWQGTGQFAAWVKTLASLEVIDNVRHVRAQKRDRGQDTSLSRADDDVEPRRSAESVFDDQRRFDALLKQVAALKPDQAAAVLMHHMGFSHAEIGDALDCSAEAARKLVSRAHRKLIEE